MILAAVIAGGFASAAYLVIEATEYQLSELRLSRIAASLAEQQPPLKAHPLGNVRVALGAQVPPLLVGLAPGHHELALDGRDVNVLIGIHGGERYAIIDDISDFERVEHMAFIGLAVAFVASVLLALLVARAAANRIIAPLTDLTASVQRDDLKDQPQLLGCSDEIGVLARAFDARATQLRDVLSRERLFTADVSHELRTPLTVILGAAELLNSRLVSQADLGAAAERIRRTASETSVRVSALLQLARSPDTIESTLFSLRNLVEQEIEHCRPLLDGKPVELILDSPADVWIHAAYDLAAIVVGNLLRNACYYTQRGAVRVVLQPTGLVIEDTGPGVSPDVRDRVLEGLDQRSTDASTRPGLGLSIVKRVARHLGWVVGLEDAPQGGSRFTLVFA